MDQVLAPRRSSSERLKQVCMFCRAGCGAMRIAPLTGRDQIVDRSVGALLQRKGPSAWRQEA
eukprot:15300214-Alexandrium_andersonii.AAC.1